eukprot:UN02903
MVFLMRLLRIVPMMMYTTAIQWQISDQISYGYHVTSRSTFTGFCNDDWYKVLFFYANLTDPASSASKCMGQLWYIQCDVQMFLLLPFMVLVFCYNKFYGLLSSLLPIVVCLIIRFYYAFYYHFTANQIYPGFPPIHGGDQMSLSYTQPWTRMSVYFIGVALMFIFLILDEQNKRFVLCKSHYFVVILLASFIMLALVIWPYQDVEHVPNNPWSLLSHQFYFALSRPAW